MDYNSPFVKQNRLQIFKGVKRSVTFSMGQNVPNKPVVKQRGKKPYKIILPCLFSHNLFEVLYVF